MKGLRVEIYRAARGAAANGGISDRLDEVTIVGEGIPEIFEADDNAPAVKLVETAWGLRAEPVESKPEGNVGYMWGGSFIYTSDSRMPTGDRSVLKVPIPLHDRSETPETYEALSR